MAAETTASSERISQPPVSSREAHYALAALTVISALNYADRGLLSLLLDPVKRDLHVTDTALGLINGFGFVLFYSFLGLPIARWADRSDRRFILAVSLAVWSAMTCLTGLARGVWQLAFTRFGVGVGEAGGVAPSHSMLSDLYTKDELPRALSILTVGSRLGVLIGSVLAGYVDQHYGWRAAFLAVGLPGIAVALFFRLTVREPVRGAMEPARASAKILPVVQTTLFLLRQRSFVFITIGGSLMGITVYGFQSWVPAFLRRIHHLSSFQVGAYQGIVSGVIGAGGVLLGGFLAERLGKRDARWRVYVPALACMICCPLYLLFLFLPTVFASLFFLALAIIATSAYLGPTFAVYQTVSKVRMRAFASALFLFIGNPIGLGVGSGLVGWLNDRLLPRYGDVAVRYSLVAPAVFALVGGALFWLGSRYIEADIATAAAPDD
jgi:predicted MFS family arabinose efflux permease